MTGHFTECFLAAGHFQECLPEIGHFKECFLVNGHFAESCLSARGQLLACFLADASVLVRGRVHSADLLLYTEMLSVHWPLLQNAFS